MTIDRLDEAAGVLVLAGAEYAKAVRAGAVGLGLLVGIGEDQLQIFARLQQQLVAAGEGPLEVEIFFLVQIGVIAGLRDSCRQRIADGQETIGLRVGDTGLLHQQGIIDKARIEIISGRGAKGDVVAHQRDVEDDVALVTDVVAMRLDRRAAMHFELDSIGIRALRDVADRARQRAETVERALRAQQRFDAVDVEELEVVIDRYFAQIDTQGIVIDCAAITGIVRTEAAQHDRAGRTRSGVRNGHAGGKIGNVANVGDALALQLFRPDGRDIDRRVEDRGRTTGRRDHDRIACGRVFDHRVLCSGRRSDNDAGKSGRRKQSQL